MAMIYPNNDSGNPSITYLELGFRTFRTRFCDTMRPLSAARCFGCFKLIVKLLQYAVSSGQDTATASKPILLSCFESLCLSFLLLAGINPSCRNVTFSLVELAM